MFVPIILAAGESTRMGRLKPLCEFDGRTALQVAIDTARQADLAPPIVVLGHGADEIRAQVPLDGLTVEINEHFTLGQTSSLKVGLAKLPAGARAFLLWPADYPLICADDIRELQISWDMMHSRGKRIFIPSYGLKRGHPALIDVGIRTAFEALADDAPARTVINRHAQLIQHVDVPNSYVLMDMDTPDEYDKCLDAFRKRERDRNR